MVETSSGTALLRRDIFWSACLWAAPNIRSPVRSKAKRQPPCVSRANDYPDDAFHYIPNWLIRDRIAQEYLASPRGSRRIELSGTTARSPPCKLCDPQTG